MKVLLVDDSKLQRFAIQKNLEKAKFSVISAADGDEGLRLATTQAPDIILLDMMLPKKSGLEVLRSLKQRPETKDIPVVVLSGLSKGNQAKLEQEGAAGFCEKNEDLFESGSGALINTIQQALASRKQKSAGLQMSKPSHGFSLIELLIVVAIILIIAAIAIPNLLRARIAANESSAVSSIRTMNTAQVTYQSTYPNVGYATTIRSLGPPAATGCPAAGPTAASACLIDWVLANATAPATPKSGYYFALGTVGAPIALQYTIGGAPASFNQTGVRGFCSNEDGVIRFTASLNGPPVNTNANCVAYIQLQ